MPTVLEEKQMKMDLKERKKAVESISEMMGTPPLRKRPEDARKWIFISNKKKHNYDLDSAVHGLKNIGWEQGNYKVEVGDIVYLYQANPEKFIRYKMVVTSISNELTISDETPYGGSPAGIPAFEFGITLDYEFVNPVTFSELTKHGISEGRINITSSDRKPEAFEFLEECEVKDREGKYSLPGDTEEHYSAAKGGIRTAEVKQRVNQSVFRENLIKKYGKCAICGNDEIPLLNASHIMPWRVCAADEMTDVNNGLLLCPNHDRCFDLGMISFDENGKIMIASRLSKENRTLLNIKSSQKIKMNKAMKYYMEYHRENVFKG